jgi:hypothetical protein
VSKLNAVRGEPRCFDLSHGLGIIDALSGQLAVSLDLLLHTFNQKHYVTNPGLRMVQPYPKDGSCFNTGPRPAPPDRPATLLFALSPAHAGDAGRDIAVALSFLISIPNFPPFAP